MHILHVKEHNLLKVSPKLQKVFLHFSTSKEVCFLHVHVQRCFIIACIYMGRTVSDKLTLHTSHTSIIKVTSAVIMCSNVLGLTPGGCRPFHFPLFLPHVRHLKFLYLLFLFTEAAADGAGQVDDGDIRPRRAVYPAETRAFEHAGDQSHRAKPVPGYVRRQRAPGHQRGIFWATLEASSAKRAVATAAQRNYRQ